MRSRNWELFSSLKAGGAPSASLDMLLGVIGGVGKPVAVQQGLLREWLASPAAIPAPPKLLKAVRTFLEVDSDG
jgi:hypothetical protein